jgi:ribosomal protein L12E/L44/L45/RPP1/RPP2
VLQALTQVQQEQALERWVLQALTQVQQEQALERWAMVRLVWLVRQELQGTGAGAGAEAGGGAEDAEEGGEKEKEKEKEKEDVVEEDAGDGDGILDNSLFQNWVAATIGAGGGGGGDGGGGGAGARATRAMPPPEPPAAALLWHDDQQRVQLRIRLNRVRELREALVMRIAIARIATANGIELTAPLMWAQVWAQEQARAQQLERMALGLGTPNDLIPLIERGQQATELLHLERMAANLRRLVQAVDAQVPWLLHAQVPGLLQGAGVAAPAVTLTTDGLLHLAQNLLGGRQRLWHPPAAAAIRIPETEAEVRRFLNIETEAGVRRFLNVIGNRVVFQQRLTTAQAARLLDAIRYVADRFGLPVMPLIRAITQQGGFAYALRIVMLLLDAIVRRGNNNLTPPLAGAGAGARAGAGAEDAEAEHIAQARDIILGAATEEVAPQPHYH